MSAAPAAADHRDGTGWGSSRGNGADINRVPPPRSECEAPMAALASPHAQASHPSMAQQALPERALLERTLLEQTRGGGMGAFAELYTLHHREALGFARRYTSCGSIADDIVAETFTRILGALKNGGGPQNSFRAYMFATLRHVAQEWGSGREQPTDPQYLRHSHEVMPEASDRVLRQVECDEVQAAFAALPARWQAVLWHTAVECRTPLQVAQLLGIRANAVAALAYRARKGLRDAYLAGQQQGQSTRA